MRDDFSDLLGTPVPKRGRGRPTNAEIIARAKAEEAEQARQAALTQDLLSDPDNMEWLAPGAMPDPSEFVRPVGVTFIGTVLGIEPRRLHRKLAKCPIVQWQMHKGKKVPLYDFKEAMSYCVEPKIDLKTWFSSLSTTTMPPLISKAFWEAIRTKNRVMEEAGHYWHDEDVLAILGQIAMTIKDTTLLWLEDLPNRQTISNEDYHALRQQVTDLNAEICKKITEFPRERKSVSASIEREISDAGLLGFEDEEAA